MDKKKIIDLLKNYPAEHVEKFASYCIRMKNERHLSGDKKGQLKNPWMSKKDEEQVASLFKRVAIEGMLFDGVHITLQSTGISYDYVAYKNKMLLAYPESKIDLSLVYSTDEFTTSKESGSVFYKHDIKEPFNQKDQNIKGGYCVIKNERGEFLTLLSKDEIDKHRKVAKTDYIWKSWYKEMCLKTIMKKSCKYHFDDIFKGIEELDNDNYDLEKDVSKTQIETLQLEITEALEIYQGDDKETIRSLCQSKIQSNEFTVDFAKNILDQLKAVPA